MTLGRGCRPVFIALGVQHEPLDQTDLRNDVNAILGDAGGTFWKWANGWGHRGPGGLPIGLGGLLLWGLYPCFVVVSSNLLELSFVVFADRITCCHRFACLESMIVVPGLFSG
jgi:hypothetical protein